MSEKILTGALLDEQQELTLDELASLSACRVEWITELIDEGVIEPYGRYPSEWRFTGSCLMRVQTAVRLHQDLDLNVAGVALAIDLIDEIQELQALLKVLDS